MDNNKRVILLCGGSDMYKNELARSLEEVTKMMGLNTLIVDEEGLRQKIKEIGDETVIIATINPLLADLREQIIAEIEEYGFTSELVYLEVLPPEVPVKQDQQGVLKLRHCPDVVLTREMAPRESVQEIVRTLFLKEAQVTTAREIAMQAFPNSRCAAGVIVGVGSVFELPGRLADAIYPFRGGFLGYGSMCGAFTAGVFLFSLYSRAEEKDQNLMIFADWFMDTFPLGDGLSSISTEGINCEERVAAWKEHYGDEIPTQDMCRRVTGAVAAYFIQTMQDKGRQIKLGKKDDQLEIGRRTDEVKQIA